MSHGTKEVAMEAIDVQCVMCGAKPGWSCIGSPGTRLAGMRVTPHWIRREDAAGFERPLTAGEELMRDHGIVVVR